MNKYKTQKDKDKEIWRRFNATGLKPCNHTKFDYIDIGCKSCRTWENIELDVEEEAFMESCNQ